MRQVAGAVGGGRHRHLVGSRGGGIQNPRASGRGDDQPASGLSDIMHLDAVATQQDRRRPPQGHSPVGGAGQESVGTPGDTRDDAAHGTALDGLARLVHDDGLTLGAAQDHAVSQVLDRVHPRFHGKLPRDLRRGPRDAEQQSVRGAASSQDFSVVLGDVEGEDLPTHLDIRQSGSRGVEQRQPAPGTTRGHEIGRGGQGHDGNILSELEGAQDLRVVRLLQVDTQHLAVQVPYQRHPALPGRAV